MKPIVTATPDEARENLRKLAAKYKFPLAPLSRMIGRQSSYLARFVKETGTDHLKASEQKILAEFFRVDPRLFGNNEDQ